MYKKEYVSDLPDGSASSSQVPIMGGAVIIFSLVVSKIFGPGRNPGLLIKTTDCFFVVIFAKFYRYRVATKRLSQT